MSQGVLARVVGLGQGFETICTIELCWPRIAEYLNSLVKSPHNEHKECLMLIMQHKFLQQPLLLLRVLNF